MQAELAILSSNTLFTYKGKSYQKGCMCWTTINARNAGYEVIDESVNEFDKPVIACHPKLGGQLQENIKVYFASKTKVEVE